MGPDVGEVLFTVTDPSGPESSMRVTDSVVPGPYRIEAAVGSLLTVA